MKTKKTLLILLIFFTFGCDSPLSSTGPYDYFPLEVGNKWFYDYKYKHWLGAYAIRENGTASLEIISEITTDSSNNFQVKFLIEKTIIEGKTNEFGSYYEDTTHVNDEQNLDMIYKNNKIYFDWMQHNPVEKYLTEQVDTAKFGGEPTHYWGYRITYLKENTGIIRNAYHTGAGNNYTKWDYTLTDAIIN